MKDIKISELEEINDFIENNQDEVVCLCDVLDAISELSYKLQRDVKASEIINYIMKG